MSPFVIEVSPQGGAAVRETSGAVPAWALVGGTLLGSYFLGVPLVLPGAVFIAHYAFGVGWWWSVLAGLGAVAVLEIIARIVG